MELELEEAAQADKEQQEERCLPTSAASISYATPSEQPPPYGLLSLIVVQVVHEYICFIFIYICLSECERGICLLLSAAPSLLYFYCFLCPTRCPLDLHRWGCLSCIIMPISTGSGTGTGSGPDPVSGSDSASETRSQSERPGVPARRRPFE